jgi:hypothetical protein
VEDMTSEVKVMRRQEEIILSGVKVPRRKEEIILSEVKVKHVTISLFGIFFNIF